MEKNNGQRHVIIMQCGHRPVTDSHWNGILAIKALQHMFFGKSLLPPPKEKEKRKKSVSWTPSQKKQWLKFWFHKSGGCEPTIHHLHTSGWSVHIKIWYATVYLSSQNPAFMGKGNLKLKYATLKVTIPRPLSGGGLSKRNLRFKLLYIYFKHHMGSVNHQPACLVVVISLLTVT